MTYDVMIIGGGPSGLTAGIYTSRASLNTLILAGNPPGGQLMNTTDVENYPGFPEGIMGPDLVINFRKQAERFGCAVKDENVTDITGSFEEGFKVTTDVSGNEYSAKSVIIATGASAMWLGLESEEKFKGNGVSACATCDGFFFKDKVVAIVGAGDAAMEEATFLTKFATKVYVLVRGDKEGMKASKIMQQRAFDNEKVEFFFNTEVEEVLGDTKMKGLKVKNNKTGDVKEMSEVEGLFVAIGHRPSTDFLKGYIELDDKGYVVAQNGTSTSVEGVYVSGDVTDFRYRQAVTAAGFGCMAALDLEKFLAEHGVDVQPTAY